MLYIFKKSKNITMHGNNISNVAGNQINAEMVFICQSDHPNVILTNPSLVLISGSDLRKQERLPIDNVNISANRRPKNTRLLIKKRWMFGARAAVADARPQTTPHPSIPTIVTSPISYPSISQTYTRNLRGASEIIQRLYISDLSFAENPASLVSYGITHIISVVSDSVYIPSPAALYPHPQPRHLHIRIEDSPFVELAAHLPTTTQWIRDAFLSNPNARILVHCYEGISRSVSVVAAFLIAQYGYTVPEALQFIKEKRHVAQPNFGFVTQLGEYAQSLRR